MLVNVVVDGWELSDVTTAYTVQLYIPQRHTTTTSVINSLLHESNSWLKDDHHIKANLLEVKMH